MRISDWSSDVCASDLLPSPSGPPAQLACVRPHASQWLASAPPHPLPSQGREPKLAAAAAPTMAIDCRRCRSNTRRCEPHPGTPSMITRLLLPILLMTNLPARSEKHTSELQSLLRTPYD